LHDKPLRLITAMKIEPGDNSPTLRAAITVIYFRYVEDSGE
jgi:hypothetical protein